jgi:hypothetical protein
LKELWGLSISLDHFKAIFKHLNSYSLLPSGSILGHSKTHGFSPKSMNAREYVLSSVQFRAGPQPGEFPTQVRLDKITALGGGCGEILNLFLLRR